MRLMLRLTLSLIPLVLGCCVEVEPLALLYLCVILTCMFGVVVFAEASDVLF